MSDKERYEKACHAMQSGVAMWMNYDLQQTAPKHLRVGVNSALVDSSAIARLLMAKGVITEEEYYKALADQMEEEVESYRKLISDKLGGKEITLA
jgi:hypothetical protein